MSIEEQLRDLFAEQAQQAPSAEGLAGRVMRSARARRRRAVSVVVGVTVVVMLGVVAVRAPVVGGSGASGPGTGPTGGGSTSISTGSGAGGPLASAVDAACFGPYSAQALAARAGIAFDGTVAAVGSAPVVPAGGSPGEPLVPVTFEVNEWFLGGSAGTVSVLLPAPTSVVFGDDADQVGGVGAPGYGVGSRLLVSGASRPVRIGPSAMAIVAWWACGSTRFYDAEEAARWRAAMR